MRHFQPPAQLGQHPRPRVVDDRVRAAECAVVAGVDCLPLLRPGPHRRVILETDVRLYHGHQLANFGGVLLLPLELLRRHAELALHNLPLQLVFFHEVCLAHLAQYALRCTLFAV